MHGLKKWYYWQPTLLIAGIVACVALSFVPATAWMARTLLAIYLVAILIESLMRSLPRTPAIALGIITTHFAYGIGFVMGLLREKRHV